MPPLSIPLSPHARPSAGSSDVLLHFYLLQARTSLLKVLEFLNDPINCDVVAEDATVANVDRLAALVARVSAHELLRKHPAP